MTPISIAIDGPAGTGKSTLAKKIAEKLGYVYVDTGALYRTIGYYVYEKNIDPQNIMAVSSILSEIQVDMVYGDDSLQHMILNGRDVTNEIRLPVISMYAAAVAAQPSVRTFLLEMQRRLAATYNVIMDGRDIGTVVLPEAQIKIFLTASPKVRAKRRQQDLLQRGIDEPFEKILNEIQERDWNDSHRAIAPLKKSEDAVLVDTTELTFEESANMILEIIKTNTHFSSSVLT